jgi:CubicO group peptidase (beta-lactamase class C family)
MVKELPKGRSKGRVYKVPNGGIYSTPNDLAKFMRCMQGTSNALLSDENLAKMKEQLVSIGDQHFYGIGFFINQNKQLTVVNQGGVVAGYTVNFAFAKKAKLG